MLDGGVLSASPESLMLRLIILQISSVLQQFYSSCFPTACMRALLRGVMFERI